MSDGLARCNKWMFQKVKCRAYMKKVNDGRFIQKLEGSETESGLPAYLYVDTNRKNESGTDVLSKEVDEFCGELEFLKTYYRHTEKEFVGIVVGMKMLAVSAWLYVDTAFDHEGIDIGEYVGRQVKEKIKCALVYYGCNKSRYVPMDDLEIMKWRNWNE